MAIWNVWYEDWQMECCGTPFSVGDEVEWPLVLRGGADGEDWELYVSVVEGDVEAEPFGEPEESEESEELEGLEDLDDDDPDDDGRRPVLLRTDDGLAAGWACPAPPPARARAVGLLTVERHGGEWVRTRGRVRSVHVVSHVYEETATGSRMYERVPGERSLRAVETCPKWFTGDDPTWRKDGVLVALEVLGDGAARQQGQ
ncbi:DUF6578 domain-containing protein [Streptomyces endophyticus]|uniref:Uncharacterized protein n=1 Tax=Streptomyces endophyticus TaxID=714166 RepID=A0ABU6FFA1_9ACTN|nr:DUF6578 domain-containing protein [Streptomyces endophyticus]MEB8342728.1 hypothetical protein [Streptomyces endophyticus]